MIKHKQTLLLVFFVFVIAAIHLIAFPHHGLYQLRDLLLGSVPIAQAVQCLDEQSKVIDIEIKDTRFVPSRVEANLCDKLRLVNVGQMQHEPAVGPHPDHEVYPEFDAKKPLKPGEKFEFVLVRPGKYSFHDHLNVNLAGSINIRSQP